MQAELVGDLGGGLGVRQVLDASQPAVDMESQKTVRGLRPRMNQVDPTTHLLVREDQEESVPQLVLVEHALQLLARLGHTLAIVRVDDLASLGPLLERLAAHRR